MLKLLIGADWTANSTRIMQLITQDVHEKKAGRVLLVPELISHDTERRLCQCAGDTASRYAEVLSFTRLAHRVAESAGLAVTECLDNGGRVVLMAAAARELHSKLKAYAAVETKPEFLTDLVEAVDEFKRCCITSRDLLFASKQTEGVLAQKLEELALLLETYDSLCQRGKRDPRDQMTCLLEELNECTYAQDHVFYIDLFPDFTRQHMAIIEHLICHCPSVTVSLNCDRFDSTAMAFEKSVETATELVNCAKRCGVEVAIENIKPRNDHLSFLREKLFQGKIDRTINDGSLKLYQTDSAYRECVAAAQKVLELVRSGARYRDIYVVYGDQKTYRNALEMAFERCGIPSYISGTDSILSNTVISAIFTAIDATVNNFEQHDTVSYLKSILSPLDVESSDKIENYSILWGIQGRRWLTDWKFHPVGLTDIWTDADYESLALLNEARRIALTPLITLREGFEKATNLAEQIKALYQFFSDINLVTRLDAYAAEMDALGDNRSAQVLNQLWDIIISALEQLYDVLGEAKWDIQVFSRLFKLLLSQYDVGTIPPVLDAVIVGPVSAMRCQQGKHLIVIGAQEGMMPSYGGSAGVLTEQERASVRRLGIPLNGGGIYGLKTEFSEIYGIFCGAFETVTVFCSGGQPSFVYRRLAELAGGDRVINCELGISAGDRKEVSAYLVRQNAESVAVELGLGDLYKSFHDKKHYSIGSIDIKNIRNLYGECLYLSASQIDRLAECRLSYFLKYGLRAKERKTATIDPAEFGTYVHAVLENTVKDVMKLGGFHKVSVEKTVEIAQMYSVAYAKDKFRELDSDRIRYLFDRNSRELELIVRELWNELNASDFLPVAFELAFGDGCDMPAVQISGKMMQALLRGVVDRVDLWRGPEESYFRVVDYKTGRKDFDYCDVFNGLGLQMLLYLFALDRDGEKIFGNNAAPAGVQYFPARVPIVSADGLLSDVEADALRCKEWKRKGLLLKNDAVLSAMERNQESTRMPYTRKKDGSISGDLAEKSQWKVLEKYLFKQLGNMVDDIASGNISPNPYTRGASHNACTYCPYYMVCHLENVDQRRNYKTMTAQHFWEEVEKEVADNG